RAAHPERAQVGPPRRQAPEQPCSVEVARGLAGGEKEVHGGPRAGRLGGSAHEGDGDINPAAASPPSTSEATRRPKSFQRSRRSWRHSSAKKPDTSTA